MKLSDVMIGAAVGAGVMYLFDPRAGNRRRTLLRDQLMGVKVSAADRLEDACDEAIHLFEDGTRAHWTQREQIRAALKRTVTYPDAIRVEVIGNRATLRGTIMAHELLPALTAIRRVSGIESIDSQLDIHHTPANTPELGSVDSSNPHSI